MRQTTPSHLPEPAGLVGNVVDSVINAGALLRAEFHRPGGPRGGHGKAPIDSEIESFLRDRLTALHACAWHGEELPRSSGAGPDRWVVDPQDGTRAFLKGLRGSAISVALLRHDRPVLAVVYAPTAPDDGGDLFAWAEGLPPIRNGVVLAAIGPRPSLFSFEALGDPLAPWPPAAAEPKPYSHDTIIALNEEAGDFADANHACLAPAAVLAVPSIAYRLALAAVGEADVAVSLTHGLDAYDIAGGHALLAAVGGTLVELDGTPVRYAGGRTFGGCIGGRPELVDEVARRRPGTAARRPRQPVRPARRIASAQALSRAQGVLLGQLAGDALGSYVEFETPDGIRRRHPDGVTALKPGGTWNLLAGQPTDDSEMALALARSIVAAGGFDAEAVAARYIAWGASKPFDVGTTTRAGLAALAGRGRPAADSQSNGALMRVSPIGILAAGRPERAAELARQDAALTHPNPVCVAASGAFAAAIAAGIAGADHRTMWSVAYAQVGDDAGGEAVRRCLLAAMQAAPADLVHQQGWVLLALGNAFHRLGTGQPLAPAVIETVAAGGDTDTNAAICGALLGAAQGREAVPLAWRRQVLACRALRGDGVQHPRPTDYWPDDALELAEALIVTLESASD